MSRTTPSPKALRAALIATLLAGCAAPSAPSAPAPRGAAAPTGPSRALLNADALSAPIFTDDLAPNWRTWGSWSSTIDLAAAPGYAGERAISWAPTAGWAGLQFTLTTKDLATAGHTHLTFAVKAGMEHQKVHVYLTDANYQKIGAGVNLADQGGAPPMGAWKVYRIPLAALGAENRTIGSLVIQSPEAGAKPAMLIDQIGLSGGAPLPGASPTPAPTAAPSGQPTTAPGGEPAPLPTPGLATWLYVDALEEFWTHWSWASAVDFAAPGGIAGGRAIGWTAENGWAGLNIQKQAGGTDVHGATHLHLALKVARANPKLALALYDDAKTKLTQVSLAAYGAPVAGQWTYYAIPMADLGAAGKRIGGVLLQNGSGLAEPQALVDQLGFIGGTQPVPTPLPSLTPPPAPAPTPTPAPGGVVAFTVDAGATHAISPFIYGDNGVDWAAHPRMTFDRAGGNRWSAYNWENNASFAGADYYHQNDGYLSPSLKPGEAIRSHVADAKWHGAASLVTVPLLGYAAADRLGGGDVAASGPDYLQTRFRQSKARKGAPLSIAPDLTDGFVYQDEFVNWFKGQFPGLERDPKTPVFFSLDNEPDLWHETHVRIHPANPTYEEMATKTVAMAGMIKEHLPEATVFGPVSYGWSGYENLQNAPDANGRFFLDFYMDRVKAASDAAGKRLVDVLDLHWYPEAFDATNSHRVTEAASDPSTVAARVQAPRSLWDPTYVENSWIATWRTGAVRLIPRLKEKVAAHLPGTKLAFTEYYYGGGADISGGVAQADVLGVFGREGVFAANLWPLDTATHAYVYGGFSMFRNFDGAYGAFGDTGLAASTSDAAKSSVYASVDAADPAGRMVLVAINKTGQPLAADLALANAGAFARAEVYNLTSASSTPVRGADLVLPGTAAFRYTMPPMSVTTLVLRR